MWLRRFVRNLRMYSSTAEPFDVSVKNVHKAGGTFGPLATVSQEDRQFQISSGGRGGPRPLVISFGWARASHKVGEGTIYYEHNELEFMG